MKLKDQVVSLELAKKLKKAGYPQKSLYKWCDYGDKGSAYPTLMDSGSRTVRATSYGVSLVPKFYSAPTVAELGERLPYNNTIKNWQFLEPSLNIGRGDNEANARAKMWLYLKENNSLEDKE